MIWAKSENYDAKSEIIVSENSRNFAARNEKRASQEAENEFSFSNLWKET